jgi:hypothetical protein
MGLSTTSLPAEVDGTAEGTLSEGDEGGGISPTSSLSTRRAHNSHINSNKYIFSSFDDVDLLRSMSADSFMHWHQEWGTMAAVGGLRPPCLACVYFA